MLFDKQEIGRLKRLIAENEFYAKGFDTIKQSVQDIDDTFADDFCSEFPKLSEAANDKGGAAIGAWSGKAYIIAFRFLPLAFCGLVTEDYSMVDRAKRMVLAFCSSKPWLSQGRVQSNKWSSDLQTGDFGAQISTVYSMIKDYMTKEEQEFAENALWENAFLPIYNDWINPLTHIHALDTMGHNWWMVCVAGAGLALLASGKNRPGFDEYLKQVINAIIEQFNYPGNVLQNKHANFGRDGDFIEYLSYMAYDLANFVNFKEALRRSTGQTPFDDLEQTKKIGDYLITNTQFDKSKRGYSLSEFGDARDRLYPGDIYYILAFARDYKHGELLEFYHRTLGQINTVYDMYFYPTALERKLIDNYPVSKVYNDTGYAVIRSGYGHEDMYFSMKTGISWAHSHRDTGTFVLTDAGTRFVVDSGRYTYSKPLYNQYYTTPAAHNVITKDGKGIHQHTEFHGTVTAGNFPAMLEADGYRYLLANCTPPYSDVYERFFRHCIFFDRYIVMIDDVRAYEGGETQWLLHFEGAYSQEGDRVIIENGGNRLCVDTPFPTEKKYQLLKGYRGEVQGDNGLWEGCESEYFSISTPLNEDMRTKYITLFSLPGAPDTEIKAYEDEKVRRLAFGDYEIICNLSADGTAMHFNSLLKLDDIETDAFIVFKSSEGIAMHNGSYLRISGQTLYSSALKADVYINTSCLYSLVTAKTVCYTESQGQLKSYPLTAGLNQIRLNPIV